ncbi:rhamnogalacturonan lyase [Clostridium lacusfryxellense]|nr:rhamnogalacturonan lyase [Clostridium lacusfryxellense]
MKYSLAKKILPLVLATTVLYSSIISVSATQVKKENPLSKPVNCVKTSKQLEYLDRGIVATATSEGIFLSWRLLGNEVSGFSKTGLTGANFNVYRNGVKITTVEDSTNFLDKDGKATSKYYVSAVVNKKEVDQSSTITPWTNQYYDLKLKKPADGVTPPGKIWPNGEPYTYSANDMSVGDVDGDGQYEYFVKWDPSNSKDVSQVGYTGNVYIDCYKFDGTLLYRLDLGKNIRAGAHYTQFLVYDFDGDGKSETMLKTAPGTKIIRYDRAGKVTSEKYITMPKDDIAAGYTNKDDYRTSGASYVEYLVKMFMNWDKHEEVLNGNWPKTIEECFGLPAKYSYPLSRADAKELVDYYVDVFAHKAPKDTSATRNLLRQFEGFIIEGPEYLTVFNGQTGKEMETIDYKPGRTDDGLMWGDHAMGRIEPANRVDRMLAGVSYLDGKNPYAVFARGYYTRATLISYKWDGKHLKENWFVDSGFPVMSNPFNDGPHGMPGRNPEYASITTQGAHTMTTADVDGDGCDEIIYGSATIDNDGKLLYVSSGLMPQGSAAPGTIASLGHGDSIHVADIDPGRPGLEIYMCHEGGPYAPYGYALRDAATGKVIYGAYTGKDTGRCMIGDVDPTKPGLETWAVGLWTADGTKISDNTPGTNANIKWAADMTTQIVSGDRETTPTIQKWDYITNKNITVLTADGTRTNNYTKGNPSLVADIMGDWREELLVRTTDSSAIRIFMSTEVTNHKLYTLMHDTQYRTDVSRQNDGYNQPAYTSFYLASDTDWSKVSIPKFTAPNK